ncbi:hypothetical protein HYX10_03015 [Candidatus Woesearchaeota archaeon]|nr:hypothetical protein [Candidatus Woesearchaeota archaeon]
MKLLIYLLLTAALATAASADLSQYPFTFLDEGNFTGQIIVGYSAPSLDAVVATELALSLQQKANVQITAYTDELFDPNLDAIIIGQPCLNTALAEILETNACNIGLSPGEGLIKFVERHGFQYIIVTGASKEDTRKAGRYLAEHERGLMGSEARIGGTLDNPVIIDAPPLAIKKVKVECETDSDCRDDQSCVATNCLDLNCVPGTAAKSHECMESNETAPAKALTPQDVKAVVKDTVQDKKIVEPKIGFFERLIGIILSVFQ